MERHLAARAGAANDNVGFRPSLISPGPEPYSGGWSWARKGKSTWATKPGGTGLCSMPS